MHLLSVDGAGERAVVLRRFVRRDLFEREPHLAAQEAQTLGILAEFDLPVPRLLAVDPLGTECDVSAVLMTRVPGRIDFAPRDLHAFLRALAAPLPALHALGPRDGMPLYYPYFTERGRFDEPPAWVRTPDLWRKAYRLVEEPWPDAAPTLIHRDYHPGNVLWQRGRLSGITDWVNASVGPAGIDAAHCRVNLAALFGVDAAEEFRRAYEAEAGAEQHPFWDLLDALDTSGEPDVSQWHDAGRRDLTNDLLVARAEEYLESVVRRLC